MEVKKELVPPCGFYRGDCSILIAHRDDNPRLKERLAALYNVPPEDIRCEGCNAEEEKVFFYCRVCPIKTCARERGYEGCHQCADWSCGPSPSGGSWARRSGSSRKSRGTAALFDID